MPKPKTIQGPTNKPNDPGQPLPAVTVPPSVPPAPVQAPKAPTPAQVKREAAAAKKAAASKKAMAGKKYIAQVGLTNASGKNFKPGDVVTAEDFDGPVITHWLTHKVLVEKKHRKPAPDHSTMKAPRGRTAPRKVGK